MSEAFERALREVGDDYSSLPLWIAYIEFVARGDTSLDDAKRNASLRVLYQRAFAAPLAELERLWRHYEAFETRVNKSLAKSALQDGAARYMASRSCGRELALAGDAADRNALAVPPRGVPSESRLIAAWQRFIDLERTNPARLDDAGCARRVALVFEQALLVLRHWLVFLLYIYIKIQSDFLVV